METDSGRDNDGEKNREIIRVLIFRDLVVQRVGEIREDNDEQPNERRPISFPCADEAGQSRDESNWKPPRAEFAQQQAAELKKLFADDVRRKGEKNLILFARDVGPDRREASEGRPSSGSDCEQRPAEDSCRRRPTRPPRRAPRRVTACLQKSSSPCVW